MRTLEQLRIRNFKSIRDQTLDFGRLNVLIGSNGSGKSNLIQVFRMLREIADRNLARYSLSKGADNLLYFGRKVSSAMSIEVRFGDGNYCNAYHVQLIPTDEGTLAIHSEWVEFHDRDAYPNPKREFINSGAREANVGAPANLIARYVATDLDSYRVYHFHDTSDGAAAKGVSDIDNNRNLLSQAENLPAFLYWMQQREPDHVANIEDTVRQVAPFFDRFNLAPLKLDDARIRLEWRERGSDGYSNAHAISDGTFRYLSCLSEDRARTFGSEAHWSKHD